jgi:NTP pyrophosphatase (non-canonical NTP hydrolase)
MENYVELAIRTESPITMELLGRLSAQARAMHAIMGMMTELGELVDMYKRHIFYGTPLDLTNSAEEQGDVFWYQAILCDHTGITFQQCQEANIRKLATRYPNKFSEQDAVVRDLLKERDTLDEALGYVPSTFTAEHAPQSWAAPLTSPSYDGMASVGESEVLKWSELPTVDITRCQGYLMQTTKVYPRTCQTCTLGPCKFSKDQIAEAVGEHIQNHPDSQEN